MNVTRSAIFFPHLVAAMVKHGDSITSLAKEIGLSPMTLSRRLSGERDFKKPEIDKILQRYNQPYEVLFKTAV